MQSMPHSHQSPLQCLRRWSSLHAVRYGLCAFTVAVPGLLRHQSAVPILLQSSKLQHLRNGIHLFFLLAVPNRILRFFRLALHLRPLHHHQSQLPAMHQPNFLSAVRSEMGRKYLFCLRSRIHWPQLC